MQRFRKIATRLSRYIFVEAETVGHRFAQRAIGRLGVSLVRPRRFRALSPIVRHMPYQIDTVCAVLGLAFR